MVTGVRAQVKNGVSISETLEPDYVFSDNDVIRNGLSFREFINLLYNDQMAINGGSFGRRRLQQPVFSLSNGKSMTLEEVIDAIRNSVDVKGGNQASGPPGPPIVIPGAKKYSNFQELFDRYSVDRREDVAITRNGLTNMIVDLLGLRRSDAKVVATGIWDLFDIDENGQLNFDEFEAACKGGKSSLQRI